MSGKDAESLWEKSLGCLHDDVYFQVARNYLGTITTPFHKPQLNRQLTTLFSNENFIERVMAFISPWDATLISAAWLLGNPTQDELCALFTGEMDYLHVHQSVVNLEERLLLVPVVDLGPSRKALMINPLLIKRLQDRVISFQAVFPFSSTIPDSAVYQHGPDIRMLRALICMHAQGRLQPGEKGLRTLRSNAVLAMFSAWDEHELTILLPLLNHMLVRLSVIHEAQRETLLNVRRSEWILAQPPQNLLLLMLIEGAIDQQLFSQTMNQRQSIGDFFLLFQEITSTCRVVSKWDLQRICYICAARSSLTIKRNQEMVAFLELMGQVSHPVGPSGVRVAKLFLPSENTAASSVTIDTDFTISYTNEPISANGKDLLHLIAMVRKVDTVCNYELTKESFRHALDLGCSMVDIEKYLEEVTTHPIAQALKGLLSQWVQEFNSIRIFDGITVFANERVSRLIDGLPAIQEHKITCIAAGIYLMSRKTETQWRTILSDAGTVLLPHSVGEEHPSLENSGESALPTIPTALGNPILERIKSIRLIPKLSEKEPPPFLDELRKKIHSLHVNKHEEEDLLAKLSRKLIVSPSQIVKSQGRSGTVVASGFDFQGKINLIKAAVASTNDILEIHLVDDEGGTRAILVEANELIGTNRDFNLRVTLLPEREEKILSIDRIFLVRKLRRSIFFQ